MLTPVGSLVFCEAGLSSAQVYDLAFLDGNDSSVTGELKLVSAIRFLPLRKGVLHTRLLDTSRGREASYGNTYT
jgi:hypothetical protein